VGQSNRFRGRLLASEGSGRFAVELDSGGRVYAAGPSDVSAGEAVSLIVRPEELSIEVTEGNGDFNAVVTAITYLGASRQLRLASERLGELMAVVQGARHPAREGDRVAVTWEPSGAWIVPEVPSP
jgi:ABC-type Fe3+/spermidine/putrescine transport system ATPase subunit